LAILQETIVFCLFDGRVGINTTLVRWNGTHLSVLFPIVFMQHSMNALFLRYHQLEINWYFSKLLDKSTHIIKHEHQIMWWRSNAVCKRYFVLRLPIVSYMY